MSLAAYKQTIRAVETPRDIERRVILQVTADLESHSTAFDQSSSKMDRLQILNDGLSQALADNQRLWSTLKHDLADPGNALPPDVRASLISLALWVERQTASTLAAEANVEPLISVNRSVCTGLAASPAANDPA